MELALITAQQVVVLFLLIGTGMVAVKTGVLKLENKQALSNLLVYIIVPAMVVNSYRMEFSAQILRNLLRHERCVRAAGHCDHSAAHGTQDRQQDAHFPVCLHFFQRGIHGLPAHFGAVRL